MRISPFRRLVAAVALLVLAMVTVATADTTEETDTYFLNWEGCGAATQTFLSFEPGAVNGCGTAGGAPLAEVLNQAGSPSIRSYATRGAQGQTIDAARNLTGEIHVHRWTGTGSGVGQVIVEGEISLVTRAPDATKNVTTRLTFRGEGTATPTAPAFVVPFDLDLADALTGTTLQSMNLDLNIRGVHVNSGVQRGGGFSKINLPHLVTSE